MSLIHTRFIAGAAGDWQIERIAPVSGEPLAPASRLAIADARHAASEAGASWQLQGITSNTRYTTRQEADRLAAIQQGLGRPRATRAALIPIRKSAHWWALAQDERRAIMEEQSRHIAIGFDYLPAVSRRLYHARELGQPFDFLTWFEYAPADAAAFEELVARLRQSAEWRFVEREVDIRLARPGNNANGDPA
ncbi:chlorite dismutase family protein [Herbaspirillum sp. WKF16]|uniref:chlorite dismutase family protein n=1 Tax=Herbaspirillum sp. WKF16 TaxID=3028312 RepID=UPI0023A97882|nr:chlorite dismutase family protein [Herbaspirillum sp. WKF16]WDZ97244.1 chlorite dismutase family protein [Herbaspirillum sp. WKF16]